MKRLSIFKALLVSFCLVGVGLAWGQAKPTQSADELQAKADEMSKQTFKRKNGEMLTFKQILELPDKALEALMDEMPETSAEYRALDMYMDLRIAATNARIAEKDKNIAAVDADIAKKSNLVLPRYLVDIANGKN